MGGKLPPSIVCALKGEEIDDSVVTVLLNVITNSCPPSLTINVNINAVCFHTQTCIQSIGSYNTL